jgi:hypothetical protein
MPLPGGFTPLHIFLTFLGICHDWSPSLYKNGIIAVRKDTNALFAQRIQSFLVKSGAKMSQITTIAVKALFLLIFLDHPVLVYLPQISFFLKAIFCHSLTPNDVSNRNNQKNKELELNIW